MGIKLKRAAPKFARAPERIQNQQQVVVRKFIRIRERNQITLPNEVISGLSIHAGDFLEVSRTSTGLIMLRPTALVTVDSPEAKRQEALANDDISGRRYKTFDSPADFMADVKNRRISKAKGAGEKTARITS